MPLLSNPIEEASDGRPKRVTRWARMTREQKARHVGVQMLPLIIAVSALTVFAAYYYVFAPPVALVRANPQSFCDPCPKGDVGTCAPNCSACTPCPSGETGCTQTGCSKPCTAPSITSYTASAPVESGYRQAAVFWNYTGTDVTPGFTWNPSGGSQLVGPVIWSSSSSANVTLNDLTADASYDYTVSVENGCGSASDTGSFTTSGAPTNEFVGWVSPLISDAYELDPVGSSFSSGAVVDISATCEAVYQAAWAASDATQDTTLETVGFPWADVSSSGQYVLAFPESTSYDLSMSGDYPITEVVTLTLASSGVCSTSATNPDDFVNTWIGATSASNSHYLLDADNNGYWNATRWVSSSLSETNDYVSFGLQPNVAGPVPVGTAFIHDEADASCSFTYWTSNQTAQITQDIGLGTYTGTDVSKTSTNGYVSPGGFEDNNALNLENIFTGVINETPGELSQSSMYPTGAVQGVNANPVSSSDGVTLISTPPNEQLPAGWHEVFPNSGQTRSDPDSVIAYTKGTYESTSGIADDFSGSLGWAGASLIFGGSILATTTISTSIAAGTTCDFAYPGNGTDGGSPYFYYFAGEPTDNSIAAPIVDVWFVGYCGGSDGEPSC